jgi:hypothetical protein
MARRPYAPALLIADASYLPNNHSLRCDRATVSTQKVSLMAAFSTIVMFTSIYTGGEYTRTDLGIYITP